MPNIEQKSDEETIIVLVFIYGSITDHIYTSWSVLYTLPVMFIRVCMSFYEFIRDFTGLYDFIRVHESLYVFMKVYTSS